MKCVVVVRRMLLVMVLTEIRSTIEYYVLKYTRIFGGVVFGERVVSEGYFW